MLEFKIQGVEQVGLMSDYFAAWWPSQAVQLTAEALVEDARLRLEDDTSGPDGAHWDAWSEPYEATRGPGDKLLYSSGDLADSLAVQMRGGAGNVVSDEDYALTHQFGSLDKTTPDRPYAGLSRELNAALGDIFSSDFERGWLGVRA